MEFLARFWSKVQLTESCWLWTGAVSGDGYGRVRVGRGRRGYAAPAHQIAYELITGEPFPVGYDGHHVCGVRRCVRYDAAHVVPQEADEHRRTVWPFRRQQVRG